MSANDPQHAAHSNPTASFNSLANVLIRKSAVTARSWLTEGTLRWSWTPRPPSPQVMELLVMKFRFENNYLIQKIIYVVDNPSLPSLIRPLVVAPDALDTPGGCAAAPTR